MIDVEHSRHHRQPITNLSLLLTFNRAQLKRVGKVLEKQSKKKQTKKNKEREKRERKRSVYLNYERTQWEERRANGAVEEKKSTAVRNQRFIGHLHLRWTMGGRK